MKITLVEPTGRLPRSRQNSDRRRALQLALGTAGLAVLSPNQGVAAGVPWTETLARAKGQTVFFNAWAGDDKTNAFITWMDKEMQARFGVKVQHVKLKDTSEAVTRVVAEKAAGRTKDGSIDLIWINGPNFLALKQQKLLYGPFATDLPNFALVDTKGKPSNVIDFTEPVEGLASPWRMAKVVFVYDSSRIRQTPKSMEEIVAWARANPGRLTHPNARNFVGATFLKQALVELVSDPAVLQRPATDASFVDVSAPLWRWYQELRPLLWRAGKQFPENGPAQRQLLNDGEIDFYLSFSPSEAAVLVNSKQLPASTRTFSFPKGTIGNTSFVAIPFNAAHKEAAMVAANFLLEPGTQAYAQDLHSFGGYPVLDMNKLSAAQRARFENLPKHPALLTNQELGPILLEPHASWMTRITAEWERRIAAR